jgi:hypothetical protein
MFIYEGTILTTPLEEQPNAECSFLNKSARFVRERWQEGFVEGKKVGSPGPKNPQAAAPSIDVPCS